MSLQATACQEQASPVSKNWPRKATHHESVSTIHLLPLPGISSLFPLLLLRRLLCLAGSSCLLVDISKLVLWQCLQ